VNRTTLPKVEQVFEHASVASFVAFSLQLMVTGDDVLAADRLLTGAAKANADKVRHAEQRADLLAGHPITAEPFPRHAISSLVPQSLEELIEAAFRKGCIAETLSVFAAARQVDDDDDERAVLTGIVRNEARHSASFGARWRGRRPPQRIAALNAKLMQIAVDESNRCVVTQLRRVCAPDRAALGTSDWRRAVELRDVDVEMDSSRTLTDREHDRSFV
jgi:hypothetical protein